MKPTSHWLDSQLPLAVHTGPESGMPKKDWKVRLAPFEPADNSSEEAPEAIQRRAIPV